MAREKKSPLHEISQEWERLKNDDPIAYEAKMTQLRESAALRRLQREEEEKDKEDRKNWVGKHDPKLNPVGKCRFCDGDVIKRVITDFTYSSSPWRTGSIYPNSYKKHDGFYCMGCGVMYHQLIEKTK